MWQLFDPFEAWLCGYVIRTGRGRWLYRVVQRVGEWMFSGPKGAYD